tara:strand:- start:1349 stop:1840 length:492 start_codon:yes stop_codon:yes gene_type:complete
MSFFRPDALKTKVAVTSLSAVQNATTSYIYVSGTSINYTPHIDSTHVVYNTCFVANSYENPTTGDRNMTYHFKLMTGSAGGSLSEYGNNTDSNLQDTHNSTIIATLITLQHEIPVWEGEKTLQIHARNNKSPAKGNLHGAPYFDGVATPKYFYPNVMIYSIIK